MLLSRVLSYGKSQTLGSGFTTGHAPPATDCAIVHISKIEHMGQGLASSLTLHANADMALRVTSSVAARYLQVQFFMRA
jgi:hypothetical protein